jgi:hypothetical protein
VLIGVLARSGVLQHFGLADAVRAVLRPFRSLVIKGAARTCSPSPATVAGQKSLFTLASTRAEPEKYDTGFVNVAGSEGRKRVTRGVLFANLRLAVKPIWILLAGVDRQSVCDS